MVKSVNCSGRNPDLAGPWFPFIFLINQSMLKLPNLQKSNQKPKLSAAWLKSRPCLFCEVPKGAHPACLFPSVMAEYFTEEQVSEHFGQHGLWLLVPQNVPEVMMYIMFVYRIFILHIYI